MKRPLQYLEEEISDLKSSKDRLQEQLSAAQSELERLRGTTQSCLECERLTRELEQERTSLEESRKEASELLNRAITAEKQFAEGQAGYQRLQKEAAMLREALNAADEYLTARISNHGIVGRTQVLPKIKAALIQPPSDWLAKHDAKMRNKALEDVRKLIGSIDDGEQSAYRHCQEALITLKGQS